MSYYSDNVLLLNGAWCLADFGISRYTQASTAPDTQKFALTAAYAAPERWRLDRATIAADVYALGVIAHELLAGRQPFLGPAVDDYRDQHLHQSPPQLVGVATRLRALVDECLYKPAGARPTPENLLTRIERAGSASPLGGASRLADAARADVNRAAELARKESLARTEYERRSALREVAHRSLTTICDEMIELVEAEAPNASVERRPDVGWSVSLSQARMIISTPAVSPTTWGSQAPPFDVICHSTASVVGASNYAGYRGRIHSLYYCDARERGAYGWFEMAFMDTTLLRRSPDQVPYALDPGETVRMAFSATMATVQLAWPVTPLVAGDLDDFLDRWLGWLGSAAQGQLMEPMVMPERPTGGSWRVS